MPNIAYIDSTFDKSTLMERYLYAPFTIISREDNNTIYCFLDRNTPESHRLSMEYSLDLGVTWHTVSSVWNGGSATEIATINKGETVMFAAANESYKLLSGNELYPTFSTTGEFDVMGLLSTIGGGGAEGSMGLLKGTKVVDASKLVLSDTGHPNYYGFAYMFQNCTNLIAAPELPAIELSQYCYTGMFAGCTKLQNAPALPATELSQGCYSGMFNGCASLTVPPILSAKTLASYCYSDMFNGCHNLKYAPALPATTLANGCYYYMFKDCVSITEAPDLEAQTLPTNCYAYMFNGCSSLNYIKINATSRESDSISNWVADVAPSGTFVKNPSATYTIDSPSGVPIGWTLFNIGEDIKNSYNIRLSVSPNGAGTVTGNGSYNHGDTVTVTATAATGYKFVRWEQYVGGTKRETVSFDASYSFTVNNNVHLLAVFADSEEVLENNTEYFYIYSLVDNNEVYLKIDEDFATYFNNSYTLHYKINDGSWYTRTITYTLSSGEQRFFIAQLSANDKLYLGADYNAYAIKDEWDEMHIGPRFDVTKYYLIAGNILSLLYYSDNTNSTSTEFYYYENVDIADYCFYKFFESQTNLQAIAANSVFKDVAIGIASFEFMFSGCTDITQMPNLPYTTLAPYCYYYMFSGCKNLNRVKDLPATTMAEACYCNMFRGCINLTTPPALPATTLADACYKDMFYECYRLQQAPALPATTLAEACYEEMFYKCTSLTTPPALPATNLDVYCYDHMFVECTSLTTAPALPATTLANGCYQYMFGGCTNIQQAPELPAPILVSNCYAYMFQHCKSLNYIKIYATERQENSLYNWVEDVAWYGTFIKMQNTEYPIDSNHGIPEGWTIYNMDGSSMLYNVHIVNSNLNGGEIEVMYNHFSPLPLDSEVPAESNITVIAHPFTGYSFDGWADESGVLVYSNPSYTFIVNSDVTLVASWNTSELPTYYTISAPIGTPNGGSTLGGGTYVAGSKVTLTATANNGYKFSDWIQVSTGTSYPSYQISFTAIANDTYIAYFDKIEDSTPTENDYEHMYFTVESLANNNEVFVSFYKYESSYLTQSDFSIEYKYHTDGYWQYKNIYDITTPVNSYKFLLNSGEKISFRNFDFGSNNLKCNIHITGSANYNVYGNIASLDKRVASSNSTDSYFANDCPRYEERYNNLFCNMFNNNGMNAGNNSLVDASNLILSLKTINNDNVYDWYRFDSMFQNCTSLTGAPSLPRTYLQEKSYYNMFRGCTSLTTAPDLPAYNIGNSCYEQMFMNCTSLVTPPIISATYMTSYACSYMFKGCTSLVIPPALSALVLGRYCYNHMFEGCTSLTTAPELPATTLLDACYNYMFYNCSSLNYIKCLAKGDRTNGTNTHYWVYGVAEHGTFEKDENATWSIGESGIPTTWVESGNDPQIPVTSYYFSATNNDNNAGYISVSPNVNGTYVEQGTTITLTAYAYNDFEFDCWKEINSNTVVSTNSTLTFTMGSSDIHIVAYWKYDEDMTGIDFENHYFEVQSMANNNEIFITVYNCSDISQWYQGITQSDFTVESWKVGSQGATWTTDYDEIYPSNSNHSEVHISADGNNLTRPFGYIYYLNSGDTIRFRNINHNNAGVPYIHVEGKYSYCVQGNIRSLSGYNSNSTHKYYDGTGISNRFNLSYMFGRNYMYGENIRDMVTGNFEDTNNINDASCLVLCDPSESSFKRMFANCTSLTDAPDLPATDLTNECYQQMFVNCTSLIEPPTLFATTLKYKCYDHMFYGCTLLNKINCYASITDSVNHTNNWLYGVAQTGDFYKNSYNNSWISGASGIPTGWISYGRPISNNSSNSSSSTTISYTLTVSYPTIYDNRYGPNKAEVTVTTNGISSDIYFGESQTYAVIYEDSVSIKLHSYRGVSGNLIPGSININGFYINLADVSSAYYSGIRRVEWIDENTAICIIRVNESLDIKAYFSIAPNDWQGPSVTSWFSPFY